VDQYDKGADTGPFRITIRRKYRPEKTEQSKPLDRDIYKDGHQKYFDDRNYIDTFRWPLSSYGTARREHIPGIIEALKEGLSSPRIVNYVLIYLYHYGLFGQARELLFHIPSEWEKRYSIILQLKGMVEFISGNHSKALKICEKAERYFPEDTRNLENLGKILLLLGDTAQANKIFEKVRDMFNRKGLSDTRPYLNTFLEIIDRNAGRTPTLSLCMIVRDEEETMPQALQYIAEGVDEIVVVDTGSKDKTKEMAASFGARVYDYQWQDDFAAARNFAIEQATGDYVFMVDADESLSTFHLLNFRVLKSLLPLEEPQAFRVPIGKLNIKTDWIHIASGVDNFVCESKPIRIFPRLPGIIYSRRVCEDIQEAIDEKEIHILDLPPSEIYLLHDERDREKRKTRKIGAYRQEDAESQTVILNAIQDFSRLGMEKETIYWLETLSDQYDEEPWAWRYEIWLAKLLESSKPERSYEILKDLRTKYPENESILNELASYLIRFNRLSDLASTDFPALHESNASKALSFLDYKIYSALSDFLGENINTAVDSLDRVLSENSGYLLGQTARFFILATVGEIEGSIRALGDILEIVDRPRDTFENSFLECLQLGEEACDLLQRKEKFVERGLILQGIINMEKHLEVV
jgi:glycosyltransferase involved in cell wall biosynthesis